MSLEIFADIEQGTPVWFAARCGLPTASRFKDILAKGEGKTRLSYLRTLAGEILTGEPAESYSNPYMERGHEQEPAARADYAFLTDATLTRIGFARNGRKGCSPDSLVGNDGILEVKTAMAAIQVGYIIKGDFPPEHKAQTQGALWVCERDWVDIAIYSPGLPLFVKRASRDEAYIRDLDKEVARFCEELDETVERVRSYGLPPTPALKAKFADSLLMAG